MTHAVTWFEIWGQDGKALQDFYKKTFKWNMSVLKEMGDYGMTQIGAESKAIDGGVFGAQPGQPPSGVTVYISTENIDEHLKRIEKAGGKTIMPKTVVPNMVTFAHFADPAGNVVGLVEPQTSAAPAAEEKPAKAKAAKPAKAKAAKPAKAKAPAKKAVKKAAKKKAAKKR